MPADHDPTHGLGSSVRLVDITKVYEGRKQGEEVEALASITVDFAPEDFTSIVGPSGCGKSTLLRMIAGLATPSSGQIYVDDTPVKGPSPDRGMMFQQYALFPWKTVWDNIDFGPRARGWSRGKRKPIVERYINQVGLNGFERKYPFELSGGMQQRVALARMLANEPSVLLMDEPLAALDAQTRLILQDELLNVWGEGGPGSKRRTMLYVTHDIQEAAYLSDRVIVLHRRPGSIAADIKIELPRPRIEVRGHPDFAGYRDKIWELIRDEAYEAAHEG